MPTYLQDSGGLAKIKPDPTAIEQAQLAAAAEIDEAFASAGYVIPVDAAALPLEVRTRFLARLAATEHALAAHRLVAADTDNKGEPSLIGKEYARARAWLAAIAAGKTQPPLGVLQDASPGGFSVIGDADYQTDVDRVLGLSAYHLE